MLKKGNFRLGEYELFIKTKTEKTDVGAIVARFQVHSLTDAHKDLIKTVLENHERVIVFLGMSVLRNTQKNPIDFRNRRAMILEEFPHLEVFYIEDVKEDKVWSENIDKQIRKLLQPEQTITLYGSRDSFLDNYSGKFPTTELVSEHYDSGTEIRKKIINFYHPSKDFRAGLIAATGMRFPVSYQTVDIAVLNEDGTSVLLAQKPNEQGWRFIGGFSDTRSESLEEDAKREVSEEANIEVGDLKYIASCKIDDWRYKGEKDCIKTAFFTAKYIFGRPEAGDDICKLKWFKIKELREDDFVDTHKKLFEIFKSKVY